MPEEQGSDKRRATRIKRHFLLKIRQTNPPTISQNWDITTARNISKAGILFFSSNHYDIGAELEVSVTNPVRWKDGQSRFHGIVNRCQPVKSMENMYEVAVDLTRVEEEGKKYFDEAIDYFLQRKTIKEERETD